MAEIESFPSDPQQMEKAKEILLVLANAVSAAKLFPADHQTVANFVSDLHGRLTHYLDEYWKLELGIGERAFTLEGKSTYEDPHPVKSLPFFFFKDGMQKLYFYKGLTREELQGFLETIRSVSQLPPEEGDIVDALWEKDFANIRYLAPDDFLETKIGVGRPSLRPTIERDKLSRGRIELAAEDLEEMRSTISSLGRASYLEAGAAGDSGSAVPADPTAVTDEDEMREIDSLLQSSRHISPEDEYLNLVVELIYLEDRADQFPAIVAVLEQYHQDIVAKKEFAKAALLVRTLSEIRDRFAKTDKRKSELIGSVIGFLKRKSVLTELKDSVDFSSVKDMNGLLAYLKLFGPQAAVLIADIYEQVRNPEWRVAALEMLAKIGQEDIQALENLIQESRPALSQEVIRLLGEKQDRRFVTLLANVVSYKNPVIKKAAIRALGKISDEAANKILLGFLFDPNEDVRITALDNLKKTGDRQIVSHVAGFISEKDFAKKSAPEKKALFDVLGRSDSEEACAFLAGILGKVPFLPKPKNTELCLYAVSALTGMKHPRSLEILVKGSKRRNLKIRNACLKGLQFRSKIPITFTGRMPQ
ncbi:MAG: HEAT repeat domain-containing protein [Candidatus Aminicenantales bacterium]